VFVFSYSMNYFENTPKMATPFSEKTLLIVSKMCYILPVSWAHTAKPYQLFICGFHTQPLKLTESFSKALRSLWVPFVSSFAVAEPPVPLAGLPRSRVPSSGYRDIATAGKPVSHQWYNWTCSRNIWLTGWTLWPH